MKPLLPTMLFGIPGSGSIAVFLGGMVLIGIEPGPSMVGPDLNITYSIIWSLALADIMGAGICMMLAQPISKLTAVPFRYLAPCMIALIRFAAFFGLALWDASAHSFLGAVFPLGVGAVGAVFGVILLSHLWRGHEDHQLRPVTSRQKAVMRLWPFRDLSASPLAC